MNVDSERRERRHDRLVEYAQLTTRFDDMIEKMDEFQNGMEAKFDNLSRTVQQNKELVSLNDCTSIKIKTPSATHGKYNLNLPGAGSVDAQCVMDSDGKGWTVIMARDDNKRPHADFDKSKKKHKTNYYNASFAFFFGKQKIPKRYIKR